MRIGTQARSFGRGIYEQESQFLSVLGDAAALGFEGVECNWKNVERYFDCPETFRAVLARHGLDFIGAHYGGALGDSGAVEGLRADIRRISEFVAAVGGEFIVFSCRPPEADEDNEPFWERVAGNLTAVGELCRASGAELACHNHWWEPAGTGLDTLLKHTDPALVGFAFDTGHYTRAGLDAAAAISELGDRIALLHVADWDGDRRPPLGEGTLDLDAVKEALTNGPFKGWLVLEEETQFGDAAAHVSASLKTLRSLVV
jgi:inosose dehydratase